MILNEMTRKDFQNIPYIDEDKIYYFNSIIVLPNRKKHSSGYGMFEVVLLNRDNIIGKVKEYDVTYIDLTGKYDLISIDCLYKSKLVRVMFHKTYIIKYGFRVEQIENFKI